MTNFITTHQIPDYKALNIKIAATGVIALASLGIGISGTVPDKGIIKAVALGVSVGFSTLCCKSALEAATSANAYEAHTQLQQETHLQQAAKLASLSLEAHEVIAEEKVLAEVASLLPTPVQQPLPIATAPTPLQQPLNVATAPTSVPQPPTVATAPTPVPQKTVATPSPIPDGATLIKPEALNDVNKYPVVMVVAEQGSGKTVTVATIFEQLQGHKVLATPKIQDHRNSALSQVYSLKFGYDTKKECGMYTGHVDDYDSLEHHDLSWYLEENSEGSHYLDFVLATMRESINRQKYGMETDAPYWRIFGDEWSAIYSNGFSDPLRERKEINQAKGYLEQCIRSAFFNFRGQRVQLFVGCQSETIDSIGAKGIASARDIAWHLYPGKAAIEVAKKLNKHSLSKYLADKVNQGYGVALLEKNGIYFEVVELPTLEYMAKFDPCL